MRSLLAIVALLLAGMMGCARRAGPDETEAAAENGQSAANTLDMSPAAVLTRLGGQVMRDSDGRAKSITLAAGNCNDAALQYVAEFPSVEGLNLRDTEVGDAGLACLRPLANLRRLVLAHTRVTDEGLAEVARLPQIELLDLEGTRVTNAGLERLHALKGLRRLDLTATRVTDSGVERLRAALPGVHITR